MTMSAKSTPSVPWELVDRVFDSLAPSWILDLETDEPTSSLDDALFTSMSATLLSCRSVSRSFRDRANKRLFYRLAFHVDDHVSKSLRRLQKLLELEDADSVFRYVQVLEYVQERSTRFDEDLHRALGGVLRGLLDVGGSSIQPGAPLLTGAQGPGNDEATSNRLGQRRQMKTIRLQFGSEIRPARSWSNFDEAFHHALKEISRSSLTGQLTVEYLADLPPQFFDDTTIPTLHLRSVQPSFADFLRSRTKRVTRIPASQVQGDLSHQAEKSPAPSLPAFVELSTDFLVPMDLSGRQIKKLIVTNQISPEGIRLIYAKSDSLEHIRVNVHEHDLNQPSFPFSRTLPPIPIFPHLKSITAVAANSQIWPIGDIYNIHQVPVFQETLVIERFLVPENLPSLEKITFEVPLRIQPQMARSNIRFGQVWSEFDEALCAVMERYKRRGGRFMRPEFWMVFHVHIVFMTAQGPVAGSVEAERAYWIASQWPSQGAGIEAAFPQTFKHFGGWIKFAQEYKISPVSPGD